MIIKYEFSNETVEIEVEDRWADVMLELDRREYNANHRETRRHCSLDALNLDDSFLPSDTDVEGDYIREAEAERLHAAIAKLSPRQQYLIQQVYFENRSYADIARQEQRDRSTIRKATDAAVKKLKKFLD